ncbi:hypothetical protein Tco_1032944 [Tanacetum coccineum]|uniref:CCHC-type domain-containing protein n=1 Tax=Tanacetum coccineum TaxID=301880 RepID=A0ABQ5GFQ2_9ASTR
MKVNSSRNPYVIPDVKGNDALAISCIRIGGINVAGNRRLRSKCIEFGVNLLLGTCLNCTYGDGMPVTCCGCEGPLKGGFCSFCASRDGNSFDYNPNPNSFNESQKFSDYPPQPHYEMNICELCGNNAHYDYDCSPQVPFVYNQSQCFDQNFDNNFPLTSPSFTSYNIFVLFDHFHTPQYPVIHHSPQETNEEVLQAREDLMKAIQTFLRKFSRIPFGEIPKVLLIAWERFSEIKHAFTDKQYQQEDIQELMSKLLEDVQNINEELSEFINSPSWNRPTFYNGDDEYTLIYRKPKAITPDLPIEEPDNSLNMGDEHFNTILETEKSSVENLVPIPSEFKGISEDICDVPSCDYFDAECGLINSLLSRDISITSPKIDFLPEEFAGELDFIDPILPGIDEDNYDKDDFDEEEGENDNDIFQIEDEILREKLLNINLLVDKIKALKLTLFIPFVLENPSSSPIPVVDSDFLVEEVDTFLVLKDSIPPGIESDLDSEGDIHDALVINNFDELNEDECFDPGGGEIDVFANIEDDDYFPFMFVIRIFLPYLTYPEVSPLLLSTGSEDTIFDPDIST